MKSRILPIAIIIIILTGLTIVPLLAQGWPSPPACLLPMIYNQDFNNGLMGWYVNTYWPLSGIPNAVSNPFNGVAMRFQQYIQQPVDLPPGEYHLEIALLQDSVSPVCGSNDKWGHVRVSLNNQPYHEEILPNSPNNTYHQFSFDFYLAEQQGGYLRIHYFPGAGCTFWPIEMLITIIKVDWVSLCREPDPTWTPTVTGTPLDTPTPTATETAYCESTEYPTSTPYPTSTAYPTATDWLTPPIFLTPTPLPTYTPLATCPPTTAPTPYYSPTPFHFNVPLTYTGNFDDLQDGMEDFISSTTGLIDDVGDVLITSSNAVSDITSFAITTTVVISGTPTASSDLTSYFVSNMSGISHLLGYFYWLRTLKPSVFWFLLAAIAWTFIIKGLQFALRFFLNVLWPLARTLWDIIVDIWNSIPFI